MAADIHGMDFGIRVRDIVPFRLSGAIFLAVWVIAACVMVVVPFCPRVLDSGYGDKSWTRIMLASSCVAVLIFVLLEATA